MSHLFKHLPSKGNLLSSSVLLLCAIGSWVNPAQAEGSRNLYPNGATGSRASLEWVANTRYGPTAPVDNSLLRRTLLQVYANAGEYILTGSTAVGVTNGTTLGDVVIFNPGTVSGRIGNETIPATPSYQCSTQRAATLNTNQGRITSRTQELAGPDTITIPLTATRGNQISTGYVPCFYQAPTSGIYYVAFYGPSGGNSTAGGGPTGEINMAGANNFSAAQATSTAAWDVTVRSSLTSTTDINGRLFANYLALFTGGNGRSVESDIYMVTKDGYRYATDLNGLDANGWVMYGNDVGFYDSDGKTPLYHDVLGNGAQLTLLEGTTNLALPNHILFFNNPMSSAGATESIAALGIPLIPTTPTVSSASFTGTVAGNTSAQNTGGTFRFNSNVTGSYEIILSRDGVNFDPANAQNRRLVGLVTTSGIQAIAWDGRDNTGAFFPVGSNYPVRITVRNGEYHFPLLDAESSTRGGPSFNLLNASNPLGNRTGFYDDRGYRTIGGTTVGTVGTVLCGIAPPSIPNSNLITGFDTASTQRGFGSSGTNTNTSCSGAFGDAKGLDIWTYIPSSAVSTLVNIIPSTPDETIVKTHTGNFTQGGTGTYTITVTNNGGVASSGTVTVTDTLPAGLIPTAASGTGWTCSIAGQTVTCARTDVLAALASYPIITLTVSVAANAPASVTNIATVSGGNDGNTGNNSGSDPTTINPAPDLTITKTHPGNFSQGQTGATYTITATNAGSIATTGTVTVTDTIPTGLTPTAATGTGWSCSIAGQTITCTRNDGLAANTSYLPIAVTVNVASNAPGSVTNIANVAGGGEANTTNNAANDPTTIVPAADLSITKTDGQTSTTVGSAIAYTITVTNNGPSTVNSVTVTDTLPTAMQSPVFTPSTGSYNSSTGAWTGLTLASGQSITLTISGTVAASATGTITNTATVAPPSGTTDPTSGNNSATDTTTITPTADLRLTKTVNVPAPAVGATIIYTVTVTNAGPSSATGVAVQDLLPSGVTFSSATPSQGTYNNVSGRWTVGTIANGSSATLQIAVVVNTSSAVTNTAEVSASDQVDPNSTPGNNNPGENDQASVSIPFAPSASPRLQLVKRITATNSATLSNVVDDPTSTADNAPNWPSPVDANNGISTYLKGVISGSTLRPGDILEYTIYFLSDGGAAATNISLCDLVPSNSTFVPDSFSTVPVSGINLTIGAIPTNLTNVPDADGGQFFNPGAVPSVACSAANTNGAVVVNVVKSPANLPNATAPGTPNNSYGFIRFRVKIN
ncbi:DUF11 domain-containing protein [Leptolyngbya sp. FACHB-321]|uniref:DUF7507 domain-containing protein n=1 Tax=Leptolyngbya sp. FACHB-321 TaxID=2692807 RepID=UPI001681F3EA|nr:DUF11 domain-containing protein [Leptolyngbya sp. FACHB-321]MBD2038900.1 DUF11 domain-containing protein [Leptolyngbya sp. FACHB-321]